MLMNVKATWGRPIIFMSTTLKSKTFQALKKYIQGRVSSAINLTTTSAAVRELGERVRSGARVRVRSGLGSELVGRERVPTLVHDRSTARGKARVKAYRR
jgi:hypothetical protein